MKVQHTAMLVNVKISLFLYFTLKHRISYTQICQKYDKLQQFLYLSELLQILQVVTFPHLLYPSKLLKILQVATFPHLLYPSILLQILKVITFPHLLYLSKLLQIL